MSYVWGCIIIIFLNGRCESFNSLIRTTNIFSNKQAPSRDIATHFSIKEALRYITSGALLGERKLVSLLATCMHSCDYLLL